MWAGFLLQERNVFLQKLIYTIVTRQLVEFGTTFGHD
jgi:hypothetical protein